ncbi:hypothetical protein [Amycolatopsis sp. PS_44_ISF1]|nr:hypothetical protein [Amycolatopsis sp. PS_44_ISF1]MDT8912740.1 hypothetical protein [Amycolatopsis sp. PS_44_ISF1]
MTLDLPIAEASAGDAFAPTASATEAALRAAHPDAEEVCVAEPIGS